jgi:hypothetical protein
MLYGREWVMGLVKAFLLALAAGFGVVVERFDFLPPVVAAALTMILWFVLVQAWRRRHE